MENFTPTTLYAAYWGLALIALVLLSYLWVTFRPRHESLSDISRKTGEQPDVSGKLIIEHRTRIVKAMNRLTQEMEHWGEYAYYDMEERKLVELGYVRITHDLYEQPRIGEDGNPVFLCHTTFQQGFTWEGRPVFSTPFEEHVKNPALRVGVVYDCFKESNPEEIFAVLYEDVYIDGERHYFFFFCDSDGDILEEEEPLAVDEFAEKWILGVERDVGGHSLEQAS